MKKIILSTCIAALGSMAMLSLSSCGDELKPYPWVIEGDEFDEEGAGASDMGKLEQELRGAIPFMLNYSHEPTGTWAPHKYQYYRSNTIDNYAGYWTTTKANFQFGPALPCLYYDPNGYMGGAMDNQLFTQSRNAIKYASDMTQKDGTRVRKPEWRAIALIIQAYLGHEVVDFFGVAPFIDWRNNVRTTLTYQKGEDVYKQILSDLDEAIAILKERKPSSAELQKVEGTQPEKTISDWEWQRWVKFANSIKLRMAMNIVDYKSSEPTYGPQNKPFVAQSIAEEAFTDEIGVLMPGDRDIAYRTFADTHDCCLYAIGNGWNDIRLNASMENIMKRLDNPLLSVWFPKNSYPIKDKNGRKAPNGIYGVRAGIMMEDNQGPDRGGYGPFAALSSDQKNMDQPFLKVAEVTFIRAEGALRGWNMGGSAKDLYELGISECFKEWGIEDKLNKYMAQTECKPIDYTDYYDRRNSIAGRVNIGVKWNESDSKELKLEKIITQKWIANFPMGAEAWTTYRRTGYPRIFPVPINNLAGVDTEMQIRRLKFNETDNNAQEMAQIIELMGGSQTCGDRVFWDVNSATWAMDENGQYIPDNHLN